MTPTRRFLFCAILVLGLTAIAAESEVQEKYGLIRVTAQDSVSIVVQADDNSTKEFCFAYQGDLFKLPNDKPEDKFYTLFDATTIDACESPPLTNVTGNNTLMLLLRQGNCSLPDYIEFVQSSKGAGFFLGDVQAFKDTVNYTLGLNIFGTVRKDTILELKKYHDWQKDVVVQVFTFDDAFFGGSIIFLWLLACFSVAIGSVTGPCQDLQSCISCSIPSRALLYFEKRREKCTKFWRKAIPKKEKQKKSNTSSRQQILDGSSTSSSEPKNFQLNFTVTVVFSLVVCITTTLLLLYFFYKYLVYLFMFVFCCASGRAVYDILANIAHVFKFDACSPRIRGCALHRIFLLAIAITLPVLWFIFRHSSSIWILQDILGVCFCVHLIQTLRIPNLQICTCLLVLLFIYDIFFVFVTPYFTSDGKSVMVEVATGGSSGEALPLLIKFPRLVGLSACRVESYSMLGYGDIIVPGFLVCFAHSFDVIRGDKYRPYFIITLIAYGCGLSLAFVALYMSQTGQPALLYIVPTVLLAISIAGLCRRQFKELWKGSITITEVEP